MAARCISVAAVLLLSVAAAGCRLVPRNGPAPEQLAEARRLSNLGLSATDSGDLIKAEGLLEQAVQRCPTDVDARKHYARVLWERGEKMEAGGQIGEALARPAQDLYDDDELLAELEELSKTTKLDIGDEVEAVRRKLAAAIDETYRDLSPWDQVNVARHPERPVTGDYCERLFDDFVELFGDKTFGDDPAICTGFATLNGRRFLLVGHRKGRTTKERLETNFGCAHPEGYRKALEKMKLAQKLKLPIITFINTPGAYPGIGAEERGQGGAISRSIQMMWRLDVPTVAVIIGEGSSGGALGLGVADRVLMLENSTYSVISPEGCAAILWKDGSRTPDAAQALRLTAPDLMELSLIDAGVRQPVGGAHRDRGAAGLEMRRVIVDELAALEAMDTEKMLEARRLKFRRAGEIPGRFPTVQGA